MSQMGTEWGRRTSHGTEWGRRTSHGTEWGFRPAATGSGDGR
jgi:hypothetical protein